jgi:prolipoprotein diacylglyceryl transferase
MQEYWQNIYSNFDPVAFTIGPVPVHWYGIMYALALISAIFIAKWFIKHDKLNISNDLFDSYIWWAEIGVILGARIGYVLFYDTNTMYYEQVGFALGGVAGDQMGLGGQFSRYYVTFGMIIPADAATKTYKFQIYLEIYLFEL